ncbi:unnamed protein product [Moneuplotes crassus]|uniref:PHD-type domain-containing protein n=1 Tax=Euplotes crassus TaxID=5936 RepID=A0AAD2D416_EUPCR|nr:unnamed protein product [Moneuplotes crassus]
MNTLNNQTAIEAQEAAEPISQEQLIAQTNFSYQYQDDSNQKEALELAVSHQQHQIQQNDLNFQPQAPSQILESQEISLPTEAPQEDMTQQYLEAVAHQNMDINQQNLQVEAFQQQVPQMGVPQQQVPQMEIAQPQISYPLDNIQTIPNAQLAAQDHNEQNTSLGYISANNQAPVENSNLEASEGLEMLTGNYQQPVEQDKEIESQLNALNLSDRKKQVSALEIAQTTTPCVLRPRDRAPQQPIVRRKQKEVNRPPMTVDQVFIKENMCDHQIVCDICKCESYEEGDEIVICETCNVAVHQSCYGREINDSVPMDDWHCERCKYINEKKNGDFSQASCRLCHKNKGCIIRVGMYWYHTQCVNWTSEIYFGDSQKKDKLEGSLAKDGCTQVAKDTCVYCKIPDCYCIKCDILGCNEKFCVRCASERGIIKPDGHMDHLKHPDLEDVVYIFCKNHEAEGIDLIQKKDFGKLRVDPMKMMSEAKKLVQKAKKTSNRKKKEIGLSRSKSVCVVDKDQSRVKELELQCDTLKKQYAKISSLLTTGLLGGNINSKNLASVALQGIQGTSPSTSKTQRKSERKGKKREKLSCEKKAKKSKAVAKQKLLQGRKRNSDRKVRSKKSNSDSESTNDLSEVDQVMNQFEKSMTLNEQKQKKKRGRKATSKRNTEIANSIPSFGQCTKFRVSEEVMGYFSLKNEVLTCKELQQCIIQYFEAKSMYDSELKLVQAYLCPRALKLYNRDIVPLSQVVLGLVQTKHIAMDSPLTKKATEKVSLVPKVQRSARRSKRVANQIKNGTSKPPIPSKSLESLMGTDELALKGLMKLAQNPQLLAQLSKGV